MVIKWGKSIDGEINEVKNFHQDTAHPFQTYYQKCISVSYGNRTIQAFANIVAKLILKKRQQPLSFTVNRWKWQRCVFPIQINFSSSAPYFWKKEKQECFILVLTSWLLDFNYNWLYFQLTLFSSYQTIGLHPGYTNQGISCIAFVGIASKYLLF